MRRTTLFGNIAACSTVGLVFWLSICITLRLTLRVLLTYRGFMFESRGKGVSLTTKIWAVLLKSKFSNTFQAFIHEVLISAIIKFNKPSLYSFQGLLPTLPLPKLGDTIKRYLRSVRPLFDDATYEKMTREAEDFQNGIGKKLQRYLLLKSWWASNYVSDWWEEFVYLRGRIPLMVNSNYHSYDCFEIPSNNQTARAAGMVHEMLKFRVKLENEAFPPIMVQGMVPLCSFQYERMYNTARVPGIECDKIVHYEDIKHIVVLHKNCYFKVIIESKGRLFNACEIQQQLDQILKSEEKASHGEKYVGSLTAWDRTNWAKAREKFFAKGINKVALETIESAAIFLVLHDKPFEFDSDARSEKMRHYGSQSISGNIYDRWFDKSFQIIVGTNGRVRSIEIFTLKYLKLIFISTRSMPSTLGLTPQFSVTWLRKCILMN